MENAKEKYLFENAPVLKAIFKLAITSVISQLILVIYNLADTYFVDKLIDNVGELLNAAKNRIVLAVNSNIVQTYWQIGNYIVEYEQKGNERAEYGSDLLNRLSKDMGLLYMHFLQIIPTLYYQ